MAMQSETCLHCAHADFRDAAAKGMTGFLTCPTVDKWRYLNRRTVCENGRFQTASAETVQKRVEWLEKRHKQGKRPGKQA